MGYLLTFGIVFDDNQRLISNNNSIYHTCKVVRFRYENETTVRKCTLLYGFVMQMRQPYASAANRTQ